MTMHRLFTLMQLKGSFILLSILTGSAAHAANWPIKQTLSLLPQQQQQIDFQLMAGDYLAGSFQAEYSLAELSLFDQQNRPLKKLLPSPARDGQIHFVAPSEGHYYLRLVNTASTNQIQLKLNKPALAKAKPTATLLSPRLQQLSQQLQQGQDTQAFWQQLKAEGSPLIEPIAPHAADDPEGKSVVSFVWQAKQANNVKLFGGPGYQHAELQQLGNSDLWYKSYVLSNRTVMSYQIAPNVPVLAQPGRAQRVAILSTAQRDPYNPDYWQFSEQQDQYSRKSLLRMKAAPMEPWNHSDWLKANNNPHTALSHHQLFSKGLNNQREISLYKHKNADQAGKQSPLLIIFDGPSYIQQAKLPQMLDYLITQQQIPPLKAVFVSNPSAKARGEELACNPKFSDFLAQELIPWLAEQGYKAKAAATILAGSSYGGLISACTASRYPELFGGVLSLSGSFWWGPDFDYEQNHQPEWLTQQLALKPSLPIRWFLSAGVFEEQWILPSNRRLKSLLDAKHYANHYLEVAGGHDMLSWQNTLPQGLIYLLQP